MSDDHLTLRSRLESNRRRRRNWLRPVALLLGIAAGLGVGFFIGWFAWPTQFSNADPSLLAGEYRRDYTIMVAATYAQDGDLDGARRRLVALEKDEATTWLLSVTHSHILDGAAEQEIRELVLLATDLGLRSPLMVPYLPDP